MELSEGGESATLSLDTTVMVDLLRRKNERVRARFADGLAARQPMALSLIVLHELLFGVELSAKRDAERAAVRRLLVGVEVAPFEAGDMLAAARLRRSLRRAGRPIGPYDLLIAGQALARGWTVVSSDARAFRGLGELAVIHWSREAV